MRKLNIACVIDDDTMYTKILSRQLSAINFCEHLLIFHHGLEALNHFKSIIASPNLQPDVILLDLNMPVMDGWQFLDEFIEVKPVKKIKIYIVSSSIDFADHAKAATYKEVSGFYIKPITRKNLDAILSTE